MKNRNQKFVTDFLLPKNNFWVGMGSVLNLAGDYFEYNYSKSEADADNRALHSDWYNVGEDIKEAKLKFEKYNQKKLCLK